MSSKNVSITKGLATFIPGVYSLFAQRETSGTDTTSSARYCYSVWLRHLIHARPLGIRLPPPVVAELGPGNSLGVGLSALLSGAERYFGLDVVRHATTTRTLEVFDELVELFQARAPIPTEFEELQPPVDDLSFPSDQLSGELLTRSLAPSRLAAIRSDIASPRPLMVTYVAPWNSADVVQASSVDLAFSQAVLEHVDDLDDTYRALNLWLKPGGAMSHQIDFRSHGRTTEWNGHWACSDLEWRLVRGRRPYLLNREPLSMHLAAIKRHGFELVTVIRFHEGGGVERGKLVGRFRSLSDDDFETSSAFVQARVAHNRV